MAKRVVTKFATEAEEPSGGTAGETRCLRTLWRRPKRVRLNSSRACHIRPTSNLFCMKRFAAREHARN